MCLSNWSVGSLADYEVFSRIYDEVMDNYDYDLVFRWLEDLLRRHKVEVRTILEMAMGTGKLTERLTALGEVTGFDRSPEMLSIAYGALYGDPMVTMRRADLRDFDLRRNFDLIVCLCDGYNYLPTKKDLSNSFERVYAHLHSGGLFVFDMNTAYRFSEEYGAYREIREGDDYFLTWENEYDEVRRVNRYDVNIFFETRDGLYERAREVHKEYAYTREEIENLLRENGLHRMETLDGYTHKPATETSGRVSYVVIKE